MSPFPALALATLAAVGLAFGTSAHGESRRAAPGADVAMRVPATVPGALSVEQATRALRAAGWPKDRLAEALQVAGCESGWQPNAIGTAGEVGLFQVHPFHGGRFDFHGAPLDPANPVHNAYIALNIWEAEGWAPWSCRPT